MTVTTVYLIRHGETEWNLNGRWQGHADVPLNAVGEHQAGLIARRLAAEGVVFDALYSSDLARAHQTARAISAALGVEVHLDRQLREIDLGTWSGLTYEEIRTTHPEEMALLAQGHDLPRGGGESIGAMGQRVVTALEALVARHPGATLGVVSHGGCIRMLLSHAEGYYGDGFKRFPHIGNTSLSIVQITQENWIPLLINDMAHLEATHDPALVSTPPDDAERPAL